MTTPTQPQPLWTKADCDKWLRDRGQLDQTTFTALALVLASDIVYDYEAALADLRATIATLQQQLAAAQEWVPVEHLDNGIDELYAFGDEIMIGNETRGLVSFAWPEDVRYEYAVCRRTPAAPPSA